MDPLFANILQHGPEPHPTAEQLAAYRDTELPQEQVHAIWEHFSQCRTCADFYLEMTHEHPNQAYKSLSNLYDPKIWLHIQTVFLLAIKTKREQRKAFLEKWKQLTSPAVFDAVCDLLKANETLGTLWDDPFFLLLDMQDGALFITVKTVPGTSA